MKIVSFLFLALFFDYSQNENCDKYGILLYEDMNCKPIRNNRSCPSSYDCFLKSENSSQCVVRGKVYNPEENVGSHSCMVACYCNSPYVRCAVLDCFFGPRDENCYSPRVFGSCCGGKPICPPFNCSACMVNGKTYRPGESFPSKNSCEECICQEGFTGKYEEPFCKRKTCGSQLTAQDKIQNFCAPVYTKSNTENKRKCCPYFWTCDDGSENITSQGKKSDATCKFGNRTLQVGDYFYKNLEELANIKVKCECKVPPLAMCYEE